MDRYIVFSDLHISNRNSKFKKDESGVSDLLKYQLEFVKSVSDYARDSGGRVTILFLGDWTDYETLDPITQYYSNLMISTLQDSGCRCWLLEGNHCITDRGLKSTVLRAAGVLTPDVNMVISPASIARDGSALFMIPFTSDDEEFEEKLREFNAEARNYDNSVLCFHQPLVNALLDNGLKSPHGFEMTPDMVDNFTLVLGGDFHTHQEVMEKVYYAGAPFQLKFGDPINNRGFWDIEMTSSVPRMTLVENHDRIDMLTLNLDEALSMEPCNAIVRIIGTPDYRQRAALANKFYGVTYKQPKKEKETREFITLEASSVEKDDSRVVMDAINIFSPGLTDKEMSDCMNMFDRCVGE